MKRIEIANKSKKKIIRQYLDDYLMELSIYDDTVKFDKKGKPVYQYFDDYFVDDDRYPLCFYVGENLAGISLVRESEAYVYEIAEFYVFPEFRKDNNALDFANMINFKFLGTLCFSTRRENDKAVKFWNKFVAPFENVMVIKNDKWINWRISK